MVKILRDTQSVQQVTLIGAAHLPGRPQGAVAVATTNGAKAPPELHDCTEIPGIVPSASQHVITIRADAQLMQCVPPCLGNFSLMAIHLEPSSRIS